MTNTTPLPPGDAAPTPLLDALRRLIVQARQQVLRHVDVVQVQTYWHIGQHIVEFEQGGQARAAYGKRLLPPQAVGVGNWLAGKPGRLMASACCHSWEKPCRRSLARVLTPPICGTCVASSWPFQNATHCVAN